jgi:hypothetical protein
MIIIKFFVYRIGSKVKPMRKAKISTHKGVLEKTFGPYHVSLFGTDQTDISETIVMDKVSTVSYVQLNERERVSDCCLTPSEQFFSSIRVRTCFFFLFDDIRMMYVLY